MKEEEAKAEAEAEAEAEEKGIKIERKIYVYNWSIWAKSFYKTRLPYMFIGKADQDLKRM